MTPPRCSFSAPGKIHLLGEHTVVYGKPALLATIGLRAFVTITPTHTVIARSVATKQSSLYNSPSKIATLSFDKLRIARNDEKEVFKKSVESIIKRHLKIKIIPPYLLNISSQIPIGCGLGSSAAISAAYIAALLTLLKIKWDLSLVNKLTYEVEKVFHGTPSGGDNSTVVFGGLIWFRKETACLKTIQQLPFSISKTLCKNFLLIDTGKPEESTKEMVEIVKTRFKIYDLRFKKILESQEQLAKELLPVIQDSNEIELIKIIRASEMNLEKLGVVSLSVKEIIRKIEKVGGAAKISGAGGKKGPSGILLCYHPKPNILKEIANVYNLTCFDNIVLGTEGLKKEN